jgi:hypothetical protein
VGSPISQVNQSPGGERCLLAHDLINDLSVILGRCELLDELMAENADFAKHLRMLQEAATHMLNRIAERPCELASRRAEASRSFSRHEELAVTVDPI